MPDADDDLLLQQWQKEVLASISSKSPKLSEAYKKWAAQQASEVTESMKGMEPQMAFYDDFKGPKPLSDYAALEAKIVQQTYKKNGLKPAMPLPLDALYKDGFPIPAVSALAKQPSTLHDAFQVSGVISSINKYGVLSYGNAFGEPETLNVHPKSACTLPCVVHGRSDHPLKDAPVYWSKNNKSFRRLCEHDVLHPDPDSPPSKPITHTCDCVCCGQHWDNGTKGAPKKKTYEYGW